MGFLEVLSKEDCNVVDATVFKEYGHLLYLSCLYPSLQPKKKFLSIIQFILFMFSLLFNITALIITVYVAVDDETILTQSLHFIIMFGLAFFVIVSFTQSRPQFARLHRDIGQGYCIYDEETIKSVDSMQKSSSKRKRIMFFALPTFVSAIGLVIVVFGPLADYFSGKLDDRIYSKGGVSLNLPVPCWTPFGSSTIVTFLASCLMETAGHYVTVISIMSANVSVFVMVDHISMELKLLHMAIKRLNERAKVLYKNRFGNNEMKEEYLIDCYKECLKENIAHHQKILSLNSDLNEILSLCLSFGYFTGTVMIAISGVLLIFGNGHIGPLANAALMGFAEVMQVLFISWCGEEITQASKNISIILYSSEWYYLDKEFNRLLEIMLLRSQNPLLLYFNSISNLPANLETFANLMNTAYSYFNLLYAFREES